MRRYKTKQGRLPGTERHQSFRLEHLTGLLELSCPRRSVQGYSGKGLFFASHGLSPQELVK